MYYVPRTSYYVRGTLYIHMYICTGVFVHSKHYAPTYSVHVHVRGTTMYEHEIHMLNVLGCEADRSDNVASVLIGQLD